jgi:hypothetical protein
VRERMENKLFTSHEMFNYIKMMSKLNKTSLTPEQYREMLYWEKEKIDDFFKKR